MANFEKRLEKLESFHAPEIAPDVRDPVLIELLRIFDKDLPLEKIPCGVSGKKLFALMVEGAVGTSLPINSSNDFDDDDDQDD